MNKYSHKQTKELQLKQTMGKPFLFLTAFLEFPFDEANTAGFWKTGIQIIRLGF
jgi:hypothetical protein